MKQSSEKGISSQLKEVYEAQGVSTKGGTVALSTRGAPIQTTLRKSQEKTSIKFTTEALNAKQHWGVGQENEYCWEFHQD